MARVVIDHLGSIGENRNFGGSGIVEEWEVQALLGLARPAAGAGAALRAPLANG